MNKETQAIIWANAYAIFLAKSGDSERGREFADLVLYSAIIRNF